MQPPALLNVEKGERIYKCMNSEWLVDDDGPIMFRFISKLRKDGQIELVLFTQRQDNRKYILQHISFAEKDFLGMLQTIKKAVWQFFPGAKIETVDFEDMPSSSYQTAKVDEGMGWWKILLYLRLKGIINRLRWFFTRRPPQS